MGRGERVRGWTIRKKNLTVEVGGVSGRTISIRFFCDGAWVAVSRGRRIVWGDGDAPRVGEKSFSDHALGRSERTEHWPTKI